MTRSETSQDEAKNPDGPGLPWSGLALGTVDLQAIAALGRVRLVAIVGLHNSGKTTALAAGMLSRQRGSETAETFAGSFTLIGWHQITRHLKLVPHGAGFPPHTSAADRRVPSLLHMALRTNRETTHVLYTDAPGEWFREWAFNANAAPRTTWIANHADAFVLLADSEALSGSDRGAARGDYDELARRVASVARRRPVIPVRTKADIEVPHGIREHIEQLNHALFGAETLDVSATESAGASITEIVDRGTSLAVADVVNAPLEPQLRTRDPLLNYRAPMRASGKGLEQ